MNEIDANTKPKTYLFIISVKDVEKENYQGVLFPYRVLNLSER